MVILKGIPRILSPELLHALACMGHGDEIVLADANFPSSSVCRHGPREIRADASDIPDLLKAILQLFPLDQYESPNVVLMDLEPVDKERKLATPVWDIYQTIINDAEGKSLPIGKIARFDFYSRAKKAYAVVHTGEKAQYGNIILKKGIIP